LIDFPKKSRKFSGESFYSYWIGGNITALGKEKRRKIPGTGLRGCC